MTSEEDQRRHQLEVLHGIAAHGVACLSDGRLGWDTWLEHASRHGRYGFTNILLIPAQRPSATDVRSYDTWQKQGRHVRRGETGIRIISTRGKPRTVFDIAQTEGQPIEKEPSSPAEGLRRLSQVAADLGFYVDRGQGWTYLGRPHQRIPIAPELDDITAASVLAHQLAHALHPGEHIDTAATCYGVRRVLADSVAYLALAELGLPAAHLSFPPPRRWAGTDARTDAAAAIRVVGDQIVQVSTRLRRRLAAAAAKPPAPGPAENSPAEPGRTTRTRHTQQAPSTSLHDLETMLTEAHRFYQRHLPGSWAERYLASRGFTPAMQQQWQLGLAPPSRHALLEHLRDLGHHDETLIKAGLARRTDNGEPYDLFRARVLFPLRNRHGQIVGFIGRRRDQAKGPKYLNTPETALFHKSEVLFGLHEQRTRLAGTARPLLVEGPLDAIAVNAAMPEMYAAVAPCGTAITSSQLDVIATHADLETTGLVLALDGDPAGQAAAIRAWRTLRRITGPVDAAVLPHGHDPADLLSPRGRTGVHEALLSVIPLADLVVDERIQRAGGQLKFIESRLAAAQSAATLIAELPPDQIARQVTRVAARTDMDPAEVTALVAAAVSPEQPQDERLQQRPTQRRPHSTAEPPSRTSSPERTHRRTI